MSKTRIKIPATPEASIEENKHPGHSKPSVIITKTEKKPSKPDLHNAPEKHLEISRNFSNSGKVNGLYGPSLNIGSN